MHNLSGYIIIEGNIGVGKSTFAQILAEAFARAGYRAEYLPEPDETTNPFLAPYYEDPAGTAYKMQMHLLHQRFKATRYAQAAALAGKGWYILDRSYYGDICFANVQRQSGYFTEAECESYLDAHRNMREFIEQPTCAIFLKAKPETCAARICQRNRTCEAGVQLGYLQALQNEIDYLQDILTRRGPVLTLDWNEPKTREDLQQEADLIVKRLTQQTRKDWDF